MIYLDTGIDICPFHTKFVGSSGGTITGYQNSVICRCNGDGTFSIGDIDINGGILTADGVTVTGPIEFPTNGFRTSMRYYDKYNNDVSIFTTSFNCKIWDFDNGRCGAKTADFIKQPSTEDKSLMSQLENTLGKTSERDTNNSIIEYFKSIVGQIVEKDGGRSLVAYLKNIVGNGLEKTSAERTGISLLRELNHMHGAHWHPSPHECHQIPVGCGHSNPGFATFGTPYATVLIAEYMSNQDLDDNDFIYGKEFMIADGYEKPLMLKPIEVTPEWEDPPIVIEWQPLLEWSLSRYPKDEYYPLIPAPDPLEPYRDNGTIPPSGGP